MADLSDTAIVLPDQLTSQDIETYLDLMGMMGDSTGFPAVHATVVTARSDKQLAEPDIKGFGLLPAAGGVRQRPGGVDASR